MYITEDPRVAKILAEKLDRREAREKIAALPPNPKAKFGYLEWEIDEAMKGYQNHASK